ncbi:MAG: SH3 domain-containing protein [Anaerolineae bacterium]|nr:SH3 domain-containing protein [Anaerolineae bacterium]
MMRHVLSSLLCLALLSLPLPPPVARGQAPCALPPGYLSDAQADFETFGAQLGEVDSASPAELATFLLTFSEARQRYEEQTEALPSCGLRLNVLLISLLSNLQEVVAFVLAIQLDPENADQYVERIDLLNTRLNRYTERIEAETLRLQREPAIAVRYLTVEAANVRSGPGAENPTLTVIEQGARIEVISLSVDGNDNPWYEFYYGEGLETGWVLAELTQVTPPQ